MADDARLFAHLRGRWDELFRLTTVEQGMLALGQRSDDARCLRIGDQLLRHPDIHPNVERWGARTFILTEGEKLLGRYLVHRAADDQGREPVSIVAQALDWTAGQVLRGLSVLEHLDLLTWLVQGQDIAYTLAPNWKDLAGPLGFTFHTVHLESGERFNVP